MNSNMVSVLIFQSENQGENRLSSALLHDILYCRGMNMKLGYHNVHTTFDIDWSQWFAINEMLLTEKCNTVILAVPHFTFKSVVILWLPCMHFFSFRTDSFWSIGIIPGKCLCASHACFWSPSMPCCMFEGRNSGLFVSVLCKLSCRFILVHWRLYILVQWRHSKWCKSRNCDIRCYKPRLEVCRHLCLAISWSWNKTSFWI